MREISQAGLLHKLVAAVCEGVRRNHPIVQLQQRSAPALGVSADYC